MTFISGKYFLAGGSYTRSTATTSKDATAGNYLSASTINGVEIMDGTFNLNAALVDGKYSYSFSECTIFDVNGKGYTITGSEGSMAFEFTPDAADEVNLCNNVNKMEEGYLTLELITTGYECDESGWPPVYVGTGGINWTIKFESSNGRLEAGDYTVAGSAGDKHYVAGTASFLSGALCEMYGFGFNQDCSWGGNTCISTYSGVAGKCPDRTNLTVSTIHVERNGSTYHIYTDPTAEAWINYTGDIDLINPDLKLGEDYKLEKVMGATNEAIKGEGLHYIDLAMSLGNVELEGENFKGTGRILDLRLQSEDGKVAAGEYTFVKEYAEFKKLTCLTTESALYVVNDGDVTTTSVDGGKLKVAYDETTKLYTIFLQCGEDTYTYVGTLEELDPKVTFATCTKKVEGNVATLTFATEGWGAAPGAQLTLMVYTESGDIASGTYACAHAYLGKEFGPMTYKGTEFDASYQVTGGSILYTFDGAQYAAPWLLGPEVNVVNYGDYGWAGYYGFEVKIENSTYVYNGAIPDQQ